MSDWDLQQEILKEKNSDKITNVTANTKSSESIDFIFGDPVNASQQKQSNLNKPVETQNQRIIQQNIQPQNNSQNNENLQIIIPQNNSQNNENLRNIEKKNSTDMANSNPTSGTSIKRLSNEFLIFNNITI